MQKKIISKFLRLWKPFGLSPSPVSRFSSEDQYDPEEPALPLEQSVSKLRSAIQEEIKHEESNYLDYTALFDFFQSAEWTVEDHKKTPVVIMRKQLTKKLTATVLFNAASPRLKDESETSRMEEEFQEELEQETDEKRQELLLQGLELLEDKKNEYQVPAQLLLNSGKPNSLSLHINFMDAGFEVIDCNLVSVNSETLLKKILAGIEHTDFSSGWEDMDEETQEAIWKLIQSLGFNEEFSKRLRQLSLAKDQNLYFGFLNGLRDFLEFETEQ